MIEKINSILKKNVEDARKDYDIMYVITGDCGTRIVCTKDKLVPKFLEALETNTSVIVDKYDKDSDRQT